MSHPATVTATRSVNSQEDAHPDAVALTASDPLEHHDAMSQPENGSQRPSEGLARLGTRIPSDLKDELDALLEKTGMSQSTFIEMALRDALRKAKRPDKQ